MSDPLAVSIKTAAERVELSQDSIRTAINKQQLPAKRVGRVLRIRVTDLEAWFDGLDDSGATP